MNIAKNLKYLRIQSGLSYRKLGNIIDVPHTVIERVEKGLTADPQISTVKKICDYFKVSIDEFVNEDFTK
ncbi:helix-turn-helix domain-containing protein [Breznakia pachnodae]|uniref:Transcriptional regulator with XRE-family HTH domain n=1 Tax=Breznakia pachnodae TaxID=265178 RepID=A0ABU0E6F4_9FIRM|nr:helix-turn-helix transcriptional regulator [Breznakia pachnodae]MDQ0362491.1 transcriptional regulator with XRE-family HTH domain [Breznakia pachnodae]